MDIKNAKIRGIHFPENPIYLKDEGVPLGRRLYAYALYPFKGILLFLVALAVPWLVAFLGANIWTLATQFFRTGALPHDLASIQSMLVMSTSYAMWGGAALTLLGLAWLMLRR